MKRRSEYGDEKAEEGTPTRRGGSKVVRAAVPTPTSAPRKRPKKPTVATVLQMEHVITPFLLPSVGNQGMKIRDLSINNIKNLRSGTGTAELQKLKQDIRRMSEKNFKKAAKWYRMKPSQKAFKTPQEYKDAMFGWSQKTPKAYKKLLVRSGITIQDSAAYDRSVASRAMGTVTTFAAAPGPKKVSTAAPAPAAGSGFGGALVSGLGAVARAGFTGLGMVAGGAARAVKGMMAGGGPAPPPAMPAPAAPAAPAPVAVAPGPAAALPPLAPVIRVAVPRPRRRTGASTDHQFKSSAILRRKRALRGVWGWWRNEADMQYQDEQTMMVI